MTKAWSHEGTCRAYESREGASAVWRKGLGEGSSLSCRLHQQGMLEGGMDGVCIDLFHTTKIRLLPHVRSSLAWRCFPCVHDVEYSVIIFPKRCHAWKAPFPCLESRLSKGEAIPFQRRSVCPSLLLRAPCLWWSCLVVEWRRVRGGASLRRILDVRSPICVCVELRSWGEDAYVGDFYYLCSKEMIKRGGDRASSLCIHSYHLRDAL